MFIYLVTQSFFALTTFFLLSAIDSPTGCDVESLPEGVLQEVEADLYWGFTKLLDGIQVRVASARKRCEQPCLIFTYDTARKILSPTYGVQYGICLGIYLTVFLYFQDHYTFSQPGIQRMVFRLEELVHRIDGVCDGGWGLCVGSKVHVCLFLYTFLTCCCYCAFPSPAGQPP